MTHLIIGYGQIGRLIEELLIESGQKACHIDKGQSCPFTKFDFIHVCIPFSESFINDINDYLKRYICNYVIIHSTVKVGTTNKIDHKNKIYSPVNGRHDNGFLEDVKRYGKWFGTKSNISHEDIENIFKTLKCRFVIGYESLEFAKINCTNYTAYNIIFEKWLWDYCNKNDLDYNFIYREWGFNYNQGVKHGWERPVYDHMDGQIGGHCLTPNLDLIDDGFIKMLKIMGERWIK